MMPFMRQDITIDNPDSDAGHDKYGRPETKSIHSIARVQFSSNIRKNEKGEDVQTDIEIDLPPEADPVEGAKVEGETADGASFSGTVESKEEIINLTGSKVFYRTVFVNGK